MSRGSTKFTLGEDWWAVIIAFVLFFLAAVGWLGPAGLMIKF